MLTAALVALERLLLPNSCVVCDRLVAATTPDALVCAPCLSRLRPVPAGCKRCGQPMPPLGPCRFCRNWPHALVFVSSAVWLGEEARAMIHHLKYEGYSRVSDAIAERMALAMPPPEPALLAPIPLAPARLRQRGYNQAAAIAQSLGRRWRMPVDQGVLIRIKETKTQTALTPSERADNVSRAFVAAPPPSGRRRIILVDDVLTTGATLVAAAMALQEMGWQRIGAMTFARALPFVVRLESV